MPGFARMTPAALKAALHDGREVALLDAREEVPFSLRHLLFASCVPLGRIEVLVGDLVPRTGVRVVWCDDGEGLADAAAARLAALGFTDVSVLDGGVTAWEACGYPVYSGVHVPSKAFAEVVEHEAGTPYIDAAELKHLIDTRADMIIVDTRSYAEYHSNSIPGAISVPGAELVYRIRDLAPSRDTRVVVNCGGRTRSIIGAQALINAGVPNHVVSLKNGTQDWHLYGYDVVNGATRSAPEVTQAGLAAAREGAARIAALSAVQAIDAATLERWREESANRTLYVLDVRTEAEYLSGHAPGVKHIAGGQLVQETDRHLGVWGARVVLLDNDGVRATVTASWLKQMGWDAWVMSIDDAGGPTASGPHQPPVRGLDASRVKTLTPAELSDRLAAGSAIVVDLSLSSEYRAGHIPGAWYAIRSRLDADLANVPRAETLVFTSPDGTLAAVAAADRAARDDSVMAVAGGTRAWSQAGFALAAGPEHMASTPDDVRLKAREEAENIEDMMRAYLAWEIKLVDDMAADDDHRFNVARPAPGA